MGIWSSVKLKILRYFINKQNYADLILKYCSIVSFWFQTTSGFFSILFFCEKKHLKYIFTGLYCSITCHVYKSTIENPVLSSENSMFDWLKN